MALWSFKYAVAIPLAILMLVQWILGITRTRFLLSIQHLVAEIVYYYPRTPDTVLLRERLPRINLFAAILIFVAFLDAVVFCLAVVKLLNPRWKRTKLLNRLVQDGILYFVVV